MFIELYFGFLHESPPFPFHRDIQIYTWTDRLMSQAEIYKQRALCVVSLSVPPARVRAGVGVGA